MDVWATALWLMGRALALPAFDVLPSGRALGYQQMRVGAQAADSTLANALSEGTQFGLKTPEAREQVQAVCKVVDGWQAHFARVGVQARDVESLAGQVDRGFFAGAAGGVAGR